MAAFPVLILLFLLTFPGCSSTPETETRPRLDLLRLRVTAAEMGIPYVVLSREGLILSIRDLDLKALPIGEGRQIGRPEFRMSRVSSAHTYQEVRQVVEQVDEIVEDTTGSVSSLDEIVGLGDMPDRYFVCLEDGSVLLVSGDTPGGLVDWARWRFLTNKAAGTYLLERFRSVPCKFLQIEMSSQAARELYWVLRPGTPVIF